MTSVCRSEQPRPAAAARSGRAGVAWSAAAWVGVALFGLVTDAVTKAWALSALRDGNQIAVPGGVVRLQLLVNYGAAFGIGGGDESVVGWLWSRPRRPAGPANWRMRPTITTTMRGLRSCR